MGEPDAGNLHVRFEEGGGNPAPTLLVKILIFSYLGPFRLMQLIGMPHGLKIFVVY